MIRLQAQALAQERLRASLLANGSSGPLTPSLNGEPRENFQIPKCIQHRSDVKRTEVSSSATALRANNSIPCIGAKLVWVCIM